MPSSPVTPRRVLAGVLLALLTAVGLVAAPAAGAMTTVGQGFVLPSGGSLTSTANGYRLVMQGDGNLVQYTDRGTPVWNSGTAGRGPSSLHLQGDGNLVVYAANGTPTWWSGTNAGTTLAVQDDGNVVLYGRSGPVWCTCALMFQRAVGSPSRLDAGGGIVVRDNLVAGAWQLLLQTDSNLVLYGPNGATWSSNTRGSGATKLLLQPDGNLVLYRSDGVPVWWTNTNTGRSLRLGSDGGLALVDAAGGTVWSPGGVTPTGIAGDVFALLNRQRAQNGLAALTSDPRLVASAAAHNQAMSAANSLSHQLPGEADPGTRITNAGYAWRGYAENIAWTSNTTSAGAQAMQTAMYNETPPNDGHRRNILSTSLTQVGVAVLVDGRGKLWLTTDFGLPR